MLLLWCFNSWVCYSFSPANNEVQFIVSISAYSGTTKIDNINIILWQEADDSEFTIIDSLNGLSCTGNFFELRDSFYNPQIQIGNTYRLSITADVYYNGIVEQISEYRDTYY